MLVEKIKKVGSDKYQIKFKNGEAIKLSSNTIINNNLLYKKDINDELFDKIKKENEFYLLYDKVIKMISIKRRSLKEIKEYLEKNHASSKNMDKIINLIIENNLIDDNRYIEAYINDKINLSNEGPLKIKRDLEAQGIDEKLINSYIDDIDHNIVLEKLSRLINKKIASNKKDSVYILRQKILNEFLNKGYDKEDILDILDDIKMDDDKALEKEVKKLYDKYKSKYNGEELNSILRGKLYKKGFFIEHINEILNNIL